MASASKNRFSCWKNKDLEKGGERREESTCLNIKRRHLCGAESQEGKGRPSEHVSDAASITDHPNSNQTTKGDEHAKKSNLAAQLTQIFIASCVFGVCLDPLFLYIPLLNQDLKCLRLDNTIKIIALVFRSVTDLFYVGRIILQVCRFEKYSPSIRQFLLKKDSSKLIEGLLDLFPEVSKEVDSKPRIGKEIWESSIIVDILAILPLPQVAIVILFPKIRLSGSFGMLVINFLVMGQYLPRVLRIYLSCKKAKKPFKGQIPLWLKGLFNLFLYILASHVLGAFWYFFAAQQIISCWEYACEYGNGCGATTLDCHDHQTSRNITVLNNFCPIDPPNATLFDFGIYLNVLQSGALWSTDYPLKFLNSFCWGLRNLSSFASNLQPSFYTWEIAFVAFISIIGLILFVYLIGNLQTYVQLDTGSLEKQRRKNKLKKKIKEKEGKVESWLSDHGIPLSRKQKIMEHIERELQENSDFDMVKEISSIIPLEEIKSCSPLSRLRKVPLLKDMNKGGLVEISEKLHPEKYTSGQIIIEKGKTLEKMLFIVEGRVAIEKTDSSQPEHLGAGKFYGEELLFSPSWTSSRDAKSINESVRAIDDVQALVLSATDMEKLLDASSKSVVSKFMKHFSNFASPSRLTWLKKVPLLKDMDEGVLREISKKLKSQKYACGDIIIKKDQTLEIMMLFILDGHVTIVNPTRSMRPLGAGDFYGGNLLFALSWTSSGDAKPINDESVQALDDVQALVLYATDMESIGSESKSLIKKLCMETIDKKIKEIDRRVESWLSGHGIPLSRKQEIMEKIQREPVKTSDFVVEREILSILPHEDIKSCSPLSRLRKVPLLKDMDEGVLVEISEKLHPEKYTHGQIIINKDETLQMMLFIVDGRVTIKKTDGSQLEPLEAGDFYGEELLVSPLWSSSSDAKSINESVQAIDDVQALVLSATDMETLGSSSKRSIKELRMVVTFQKVPKLQTMDKQVLKAMFHSLSRVSYKRDDYIVRENQPVSRMFFVMRGEVTKNENRLKENFIGEELLEWVLDKSFPTILPLSTCTVRVVSNDAEVLILKAKILKSVVSKFMKHFRNFASPSDIRLTWLKNVPLLKDMDEGVLREISEKLKPEKYARGEIIINKDETLEMMLFIVDGHVTIKKADDSQSTLGAGNFYGEKLLLSVLWTSSSDAKPINESVQATDDVQALVLYATDMESISSKSKSHFEKLCMVTILKKVEIFQQMDERVLKAISKRLKPMSFNAKKYILKEKKPLNMMFLVVRGVVLIESESAMDVNERETVELGSFYGEELVHWSTTWVSHQTFPTRLPLSPDSALCPCHCGTVKILALKADDLKSVLSDFTLPTDSDQPRDWLTILKNVETLETMDEEVLKELCGYLELSTYEDAYIIHKDKPIEMMFFIMSGVVSVTDGSSKHYRNEGGRPNHSGNDLIEHWLQSKSTGVPAELPTSPFSFWAIGEVKVLVLKADDLAKVHPGDQIR